MQQGFVVIVGGETEMTVEVSPRGGEPRLRFRNAKSFGGSHVSEGSGR